jgi:hypothetical protein
MPSPVRQPELRIGIVALVVIVVVASATWIIRGIIIIKIHSKGITNAVVIPTQTITTKNNC